MAGPLLRGSDVALAAIDAIREDNAAKEVLVQDHGSYVRIEAEGGLLLRRTTMELALGRRFQMQEIELYLTGFSGKIELTDEYVRWFFKS